MTIARNRAIDRLRAERARGVTAALDEVPGLMSDDPPAEFALEAIALRRALDALRPEVRCALLLVFFNDYTHEDLARLLRVPVGTSKTWVRRGLAALREALE